MTTPYPFREAFQEIARRCETLFVLETTYYGPTLSEEELADELAEDDCRANLNEQLLAYGRDCNGFELEWAHTEAQEKIELPGGRQGYIKLLSLASVCGSWYFELNGEVVEEYDPNLAGLLRQFRIVDQFDQTGCVGAYYNERRDPELYFFDNGEGDLPAPLGVDLVGYVELLKLSLGYQHWQLLLIELNEYFNAPAPQAPFSLENQWANVRYFVNDMTVLDPDFTLEKFMARYDELRLRR